MNAHELLLRMVGRMPDNDLAQARRMLAGGAVNSAVTFLAALLAVNPSPLTAAELAAIRELSSDPAALPEMQQVEELPALPFIFTELDYGDAISRDQLDEAVVAAAETHGDAVSAIWRSWRYSLLASMSAGLSTNGSGSEHPPELRDATITADRLADPFSPHRVYLVQVHDQEMIQPLAASLLAAVPDSANAGVEVVSAHAELPPYQQATLAGSLLLWAETTTEPEFIVARVFDFADPVTGPDFLPDHEVIADEITRQRLLTYLGGGHPVLTTSATTTDILDPSAGSIVPGSFLTDGEWIWTDTIMYYLERHGMAPDAELTAHIERQVATGRLLGETDLETAIRASDFLLHPPAESRSTAVWFPGGASAN